MNTARKSGAADFSGVDRLLAQYWRGLYEGDAALLARVFHQKAHYATPSSGALTYYSLDAYLEIVRNRRTPKDNGDRDEYAVRSIRFAGPDVAFAEVQCGFLGRQFTDFLSLVRTGGEWRIFSKLFHYDEPGAAPAQPEKE